MRHHISSYYKRADSAPPLHPKPSNLPKIISGVVSAIILLTLVLFLLYYFRYTLLDNLLIPFYNWLTGRDRKPTGHRTWYGRRVDVEEDLEMNKLLTDSSSRQRTLRFNASHISTLRRWQKPVVPSLSSGEVSRMRGNDNMHREGTGLRELTRISEASNETEGMRMSRRASW